MLWGKTGEKTTGNADRNHSVCLYYQAFRLCQEMTTKFMATFQLQKFQNS